MNAAVVFTWMARSWAFLRDLTGDAAYEAHEARARARHEPPRRERTSTSTVSAVSTADRIAAAEEASLGRVVSHLRHRPGF